MSLPGIATKPIPRAIFEDHSGHDPYQWQVRLTAEKLFERYRLRGESTLPVILFNKGVLTAEEFIEVAGLHNICVVE